MTGGQRLAVGLIKLKCLVDDLVEFLEDLPLIAPVASTVYQAWSAAYIALVVLVPLNYLDVPGAVLHSLDSSMAALTVRTWYVFASLPNCLVLSQASVGLDEQSSDGSLAPPRLTNPVRCKSETSSRIFGGTFDRYSDGSLPVDRANVLTPVSNLNIAWSRCEGRGCPARIRTWVKGSKVPCDTTTPPGTGAPRPS